MLASYSRKTKWLYLVALCAVVSGCTDFALRELRQVEPVDSPFHQTLAGLYLDFSENEADQYDWDSSEHFAQKGLMVAYGNNVELENPDDWDLSPRDIGEAREVRETVNGYFTPEYYSSEPRKLAQLHFYYDCWVEQLSESWQSTDIELCKEQMVGTMESLNTIQRQSIWESTQENSEEEVLAPVITSNSYLLFFPWDEAKIEAGQARLELAVLLNDLEKNPNTEIIINGHADRSGSDEYNMDLSQRRAMFVRNQLIKAGVPESRIQYFAFGESDLRVPTADGVRESANRRAEIFIE